MKKQRSQDQWVRSRCFNSIFDLLPQLVGHWGRVRPKVRWTSRLLRPRHHQLSSSFTDVPPGLKSWRSCSLFCTTRRTSSGAMRFLPVVWATSPASSRMFDVKYSSTLVRNESAEELRRLEWNSSRRKRSTRLKGSSPLWERVLFCLLRLCIFLAMMSVWRFWLRWPSLLARGSPNNQPSHPPMKLSLRGLCYIILYDITGSHWTLVFSAEMPILGNSSPYWICPFYLFSFSCVCETVWVNVCLCSCFLCGHTLKGLKLISRLTLDQSSILFTKRDLSIQARAHQYSLTSHLALEILFYPPTTGIVGRPLSPPGYILLSWELFLLDFYNLTRPTCSCFLLDMMKCF